MTQRRTLYHIAEEAMLDWPIEKRPSLASAALLDIMRSCATPTRAGMVGQVVKGGVPLRSVIQAFLNNAGDWKGETAIRIKKELRACV